MLTNPWGVPMHIEISTVIIACIVGHCCAYNIVMIPQWENCDLGKLVNCSSMV